VTEQRGIKFNLSREPRLAALLVSEQLTHTCLYAEHTCRLEPRLTLCQQSTDY
jgi:hypothetical protein